MSARARSDAERVVVAEIVVRIRDCGPESEWHTDRQLFGPWYRFEAELTGEVGARALGFTPWEALHRLVANRRSELGAAGVAS
jgi:hypothetical protein